MAARLLQSGARQYAGSAEIWNLLGITDAELGRNKEAEIAFHRALSITPKSTSVNENIGLLFYRNSNFVGAKKYLASAVALGSNQPNVLFSLAAAQLRTGEPALALSNLKALEPSLNNLAAYWEERGRAELLTDPAQAETDFNQALRLEPNSVSALNAAATAAERQGLDEKALAYLIKARSIDPDNLETLLHFGAVCIRRDLGPDAIEALQKARHLDSNHTATLFLLARAHICLQDWQQAYDLFHEYSKRLPNDASAFYAMGWVEIQLDRTNDAQLHLEHSLALNPGLTDARYELAQLQLDAGQFDSAEQMLHLVLKQQPDHAKGQLAMGEILFRRGDLDGAQACFERALQLDTKLASAHYKLSTVLFRKHEEARATDERTLSH